MHALETKKIDRLPIHTNYDQQTKIEAARKSLPLQPVHTQLALAEAEFGLSYSWEEVRDTIRHTLPRKLFKERITFLHHLEAWPGRLPDKALLAYYDAKKSGRFDDFVVATPQYAQRPAPDPWLLGRILTTTPNRWNDGYLHNELRDFRYIVLAYWD